VQRLAWHRYAQTYGAAPLALTYSDLEPTAQYRFRVVYSYQGWAGWPLSSLTATGADGASALLHGFQKAPNPMGPLEFDVPRAATAGGSVTIQCQQPEGSAQNGNGRGCQISEVWLVVVPANASRAP
jgi:hypothetical protein